MANQNKNKNKQPHIPRPPALQGPQKTPTSGSSGNPPSTESTVRLANQRALDAAIEHTGDLPSLANTPPPSVEEWPTIWQLLREAQAGFEQASAAVKVAKVQFAVDEARLAKERDEVAAGQTALAAREAAWSETRTAESAHAAQRRAALESDEAALRRRSEEVTRNVQEVDVRETRIAAREAEAAAGFSAWRREQSQQLTVEVEQLRQESKLLAESLATARAAWAHEEAKLRRDLLVELAEARSRGLEKVQQQIDELLTERERTLAKRETDQRTAEAKFKADKRQLEESEADLDAEVQARTTAVREVLERRLAQELQVREGLEAELGELQQRVQAVDDWQRVLGQDPALARKRIREAELQIAKLNAQLAKLPTEGTETLLHETEANLLAARSDLDASRADNAKLRAQLATISIGVTELDTAKREAQAYRISRDLLTQRLDELENKVRSAEEANASKSPFKACAEIEQKFSSGRVVSDEPVALRALADEIRVGLARDHKLHFTERTIRTFLAGMASSRLVLLEGISGTGKTSLPLAMAKVIGAHGGRIEVQAGWRDKQDLFGHYNTFERSYNETAFLKALVAAGTPGFANRPMLVVLDEMNLSHPEQYFADVLSALEGSEARPSVEIHGVELPNSPALLKGGRVAIQPNTWFVGTANQDETTKDFADKTYDRAHVMQLPRHRPAALPSSALTGGVRKEPVAMEHLLAAFEGAKTNEAVAKAHAALSIIESRLSVQMEKDFEVGWGNRFERQTNDFVPAYLATAGKLGEAVDHLIATKLLRKIKGRHDVEVEAIRELRENVQGVLTELDGAWMQSMSKLRGAHDVQSLAILDREGRQANRTTWKAWWEAQ